MLDNLVGERVERRRNQVLFERKGAKLRELNRDLAQESSELEALALRRVELLKAEGKRYGHMFFHTPCQCWPFETLLMLALVIHPINPNPTNTPYQRFPYQRTPSTLLLVRTTATVT